MTLCYLSQLVPKHPRWLLIWDEICRNKIVTAEAHVAEF